MKNKILNIAHRGYSGQYPENTMIAFEKAVEHNCDMIEFDVHLTKDGKPIVTHDFTLGRTNNGTGTVLDHTGHELQQLDSGSWFAPEYKNQKMPYLDEVLGFVRTNALMNIEIKYESMGGQIHAYQHMSKHVLSLVEKHELLDNVVISSFDWAVLKVIRELNSEVHLGLLNHEPQKGLKLNEAVGIYPYSYHMKFDKLTDDHIDELHENDLQIYPYTANDEKDYRHLINLGVDGIISNETEKLHQFLKLSKM